MLPFFPAFLAGMNLVLIADDAFTFLLSWEFMSLASWALVMAHHREAGQSSRRAGLYRHGERRAHSPCCWLSVCWPEPKAATLSPRCAPMRRTPLVAAMVLALVLVRRRVESRPGSPACLAAAGASGGAEPCLGLDERRHDQGGGLWLHPGRVRPARTDFLVVGHTRAGRRRDDRGGRRALRAGADRSETRSRLQHD